MKNKIAIIGSGVAGLTAAYLLDQKYEITLYEKNSYIGGHTNTISVNENTSVDTGFIVMNNKNYPLFTKLLKELDVELQDSNMSFGHYDKDKCLFYNTDSILGMFSQKQNILRPSFYKMIWDILMFFKNAKKDIKTPSYDSLTLKQYLEYKEVGQAFIDNYLAPMGAAIWSTPTHKIMDFPAKSFLQFYNNHGLLSLTNRPMWKTVKGGSKTYVNKILSSFSGELLSNDAVVSIQRVNGLIIVTTESGKVDKFDKVIIATHADEAYALLDKPSKDEKRLLSPWKYSQNRTFLHTDTSILPPKNSAWASWNFCKAGENLTLTYYMNKLQNLDCNETYLVTLNPSKELKGVIKEINYTHPIYDFESFRSQKELPTISGLNNTYYCGSYHGYGFHEDAVRSAVHVSRMLGVDRL